MKFFPGRNLFEKAVVFIATGFGIGAIAPFASGTFGSLPGVALAYATSRLPVIWQIAAGGALFALAVPICDVAERVFGVKDDGRIVADEWMIYPVALVGIPFLEQPWWCMIVYFAVVRFFDIAKLPPVNSLQRLKGGFGIVIDDFVANLMSLAVNWLLFIYILQHHGI